MTNLFVLLTIVAEPLVTLLISERHDPSTRRATPLSFAHRTFLFSALLVVRETRAASKVSSLIILTIPTVSATYT